MGKEYISRSVLRHPFSGIIHSHPLPKGKLLSKASAILLFLWPKPGLVSHIRFSAGNPVLHSASSPLVRLF